MPIWICVSICAIGIMLLIMVLWVVPFLLNLCKDENIITTLDLTNIMQDERIVPTPAYEKQKEYSKKKGKMKL